MSSRRAGYQSLGDAGDSLLAAQAGGGDVEAPPGPSLTTVVTHGDAGAATAQPAAVDMPTAATAASAVPPQPPQPALFPIRILDTSGREHTVDAGSPQATVASFKERVAAATGVAPPLQRLIFCGKMLQDAQTLQAVGVTAPNVVVHLFARPTPPAGAAGGAGVPGQEGVAGGVGGVGVGGLGTGAGGGLGGGWMASFGDPELIRATHSVRLLSSCLVAVCTMQLLLLFLRLMATWQGLDGGQGQQPADDDGGKDGAGAPANIEDSSAMLFMQVLLNVLGLYVGLAGVRSANTLSLQTAKTYFYGLVAVGTLWLSLRVIWAINSVQLGYDADLGPQPGGGGGGNGTDSGGGGGGGVPGGDDDGGGGGGGAQMDRSELIYMVSLSVMIYTLVWSVCFLRASQFFNLLRRANRATA